MFPKARTYTVKPIATENTLRYVAWVRSNYDKVDRETHGRVGYIHVPNTAVAGIQEFSKGYFPQVHKEGMIVDERFNGGGFVPDFFVERLERKTWTYWSQRDGASRPRPFARPLPRPRAQYVVVMNSGNSDRHGATHWMNTNVGIPASVARPIVWCCAKGVQHDRTSRICAKAPPWHGAFERRGNHHHSHSGQSVDP